MSTIAVELQLNYIETQTQGVMADARVEGDHLGDAPCLFLKRKPLLCQSEVPSGADEGFLPEGLSEVPCCGF